MFLKKLKTYLIQELSEQLLWSFVAYICGILFCFSFLKGVRLSIISGGVVVFGLAWFCGRKNLIVSWWTMFICFFLLGILNMLVCLQLKAHPVLNHPLYQTSISASVQENRVLVDKQILTLNHIKWIDPDLKMPQKIQVHFKKLEPIFKIGDHVKATVSVYPPSEDFSPTYAHHLWFNQIGATGIAQDIQILESESKFFSFSEARHTINQHLFQILPYAQAEIIAPLITGEQKLVSKNTYQIYRRAGIAHVLSVSGFHMALLAGFLFFIIRGFCALFPRIALYYNSKKIAAVFALMGTALYLGLSGFQVPAVRAFVMIAFVFLGVLIERTVLSMRTLILTAFLILLIAPQMLFSISFQLSFVAVMVLIFICNFIGQKTWGRMTKMVSGFFLLNIGVSLSLMPLILYHFHQITPYGVLGNMLFSGMFSVFIMPLLFMGSLFMPLGLDRPFFLLAGQGVDFVRWGTGEIADFPFSEIAISTFSPIALSMIMFGLILLCLMKTPLKVIGILPMLVGIFVAIFP